MEVWSYHEATSGYTTTNLNNLAALVAGAFVSSTGGVDLGGAKTSGVNSAFSNIGSGANMGDAQPAAYLNYILFDQNYSVMDAGWQVVPAASFSKQQVTIPTVTAKQAGYIFVYLSYEDQSNNYVYFDDFKVTITPTNVIQSNEYYAHGLPTNNSWTRDNAVANNFLANGATELNSTTSLYDLDFRNFDPVLGRLNQVDPMADKYSSASVYHFSFNNPVSFTDQNGADPNGNGFVHPPDEPYDWFGFNSNMGRDQAWAHGGASSGGTIQRWSQLSNIVSDLWNSGSGGYWTENGGSYYYGSQAEAIASTTVSNQIVARYSAVLGQNGTNYIYNIGVNIAGKVVFVDSTPGAQSSNGGWYQAGKTSVYDFGGYAAIAYGTSSWPECPSCGSSDNGWQWHIGAEVNATMGRKNFDVSFKNGFAVTYRDDAKVVKQVSADTHYRPSNTTFPNSTKTVSELGVGVPFFNTSMVLTDEIDNATGKNIDSTSQFNLGAFGFGVQFNFDSRGFKDFRLGIDTGPGLSIFGGAKGNVQIGIMYVDH